MILHKTSIAYLRIAVTFVLIALLWSPFASAMERLETPAVDCVEVSVSDSHAETCEQHSHETECDHCTQLDCTHCALLGCGGCYVSLHDDDTALYLPLPPALGSSLDLYDIWPFPKAPEGLLRPPRA